MITHTHTEMCDDLFTLYERHYSKINNACRYIAVAHVPHFTVMSGKRDIQYPIIPLVAIKLKHQLWASHSLCRLGDHFNKHIPKDREYCVPIVY